MSGFPTRPVLGSFGPTIQDIAPVRNPATDLPAAAWNLMRHQVAGLGLVSPRIMAKLTVDDPAVLLARAEAWNPEAATTGQFADPVAAYVSTGRATLTYPASITDEAGAAVDVEFSWAFGWVSADPPTTVKLVQVEPVAATPRILTVCAFDASNALENGNDVWIVAG